MPPERTDGVLSHRRIEPLAVICILCPWYDHGGQGRASRVIKVGNWGRFLYVNVPSLFASALPAAGAIRDSMARKASSSKPPAPKSGFRPTLERLKPSKPIQASEAASAAQQGMLQLTFARHAHGYGFLAAFAFVFNGLLVLIFS